MRDLCEVVRFYIVGVVVQLGPIGKKKVIRYVQLGKLIFYTIWKRVTSVNFGFINHDLTISDILNFYLLDTMYY